MSIGDEITSNPIYKLMENKLGMIYATKCDGATIAHDSNYRCTGCSDAVVVPANFGHLPHCPWCGEDYIADPDHTIPDRECCSAMEYNCGTAVCICSQGHTDSYRVTAYLRSDACLLLPRLPEDDII